MNTLFYCLRASKVSILSLSVALLTVQSLANQAIASGGGDQFPEPSEVLDVEVTVDDAAGRPQSEISEPETIWSLPEFSPLPDVTNMIILDGGDRGSDALSVSAVADRNLSADTRIVQLPAGRRGLLVEEVRGEVAVNGQPAQVNEFLQQPGTQITTGRRSTARLRIDSNIGVVELAPNTTVEIQTISGSAGVDGNQMTVFSVTGGRIRLSISRFVSDIFRNLLGGGDINQIAALDTLSGLGEFGDLAQEGGSASESPLRVETPVGVAGVRGTSFGVAVGPSGKTGVSTIDGIVGVLAQGREEIVNAGFFSAISPDGAPTTAQSTPRLSDLRRFSVIRTGTNAVRLLGKVDPMDLVYVNGQAVETDADGNFEYVGGAGNGRINIVVRGPSVRERHYSLPTR